MEIDLNLIQSAVKLAGSSGQAVEKLAGGFSAIKKMIQSSQSGADSDVKLALSEMAMQLADAKLANAELTMQLASLHKAVIKAHDFKEKLDQYDLWETPFGAHVYRYQKQEQSNKPTHFICPKCVEDEKTHILQGGEVLKTCPECKTKFQISPYKKRPKPSTKRANYNIF